MDKRNERVVSANDTKDTSPEGLILKERVENCASSLSKLLDLPLGHVSVASEDNSRIADEILQVIRSDPPVELVVMGTRGHTGLKHVWDGSIAEEVIRQSPCPVCVIGPQVQKQATVPPNPSILVATDFSESAQTAEKFALHLASRCGSNIKLLFCLGDEIRAMQDAVINSGIGPYDLQLSEGELKADAEKNMAKAAARLKQNQMNITTEIRVGLSADQIPAAAKSFDLIVIGTRGRHRLLSEFFGSTARGALLSSSVPVIVVPPNMS